MKSFVPFYLDSQVVGEFDAASAPTSEGNYVYEPYRSPGHHNLHMQLKSSHIPRCLYIIGTERVEFSVVTCVEYGVLRLSGFESSRAR